MTNTPDIFNYSHKVAEEHNFKSSSVMFSLSTFIYLFFNLFFFFLCDIFIKNTVASFFWAQSK